MNPLRAELRKIFTVRSTYVIFLIMLALPVALVCFWIFGYKDVEHANLTAKALINALRVEVNVLGVLLGFVALLSVGHEYRYNTILYAITINNRRSKVFLSKLLAVLLTGLVAGAVAFVLGIVAFQLGQQLNQTAMVAQSMPDLDLIWRSTAVIAGSILLAYVIAMLVRSQIFAIALYLLLPSTVEGLLSLLLKDNVKYLPFTALNNIVSGSGPMSPVAALGVVGAYVAGFGLLAWVLFLRRDAN